MGPTPPVTTSERRGARWSVRRAVLSLALVGVCWVVVRHTFGVANFVAGMVAVAAEVAALVFGAQAWKRRR